jgi:signal transduction histidine kinase
MGLIGLVLLVIIILTGGILGIAVYSSNKKSIVGKFFLLTSISILLWNIFGYLGYWTSSDQYITIFFKLNYSAVALCFLSFYYFSVHFPIELKERKLIDFSIYFLGFVFLILSISSNWIIKDVNLLSDGSIKMQTGFLGNYFYLYTFIVTINIIYSYFKRYSSLDSDIKLKVKFFIIGTSLWALFNVIFNIIVSVFGNNYRYTQLGDFSAIFFIGFTAYAILKHQLFNIKVIATETIVVLLSIGLLVETFLSNTVGEGLIKAVVWILATYGGYRLIKSVKLEIQQAEDLRAVTKKLESTNKDLNVANEELKKLDKTKDEFISVASHELNTPLAAIEGYLSMILDEHMAKVDTKAKEYLKRAYQSSKRLAALIMDLLNVSRIEQGRIHLQYVETNICDLIEEVVHELEIKADQKKIKISFACPAKEIPKTWLDQARFHEIITNLTGNAIKFTEKGGVVVSASMKDDKVTICIKDNGIGIAKENLEKLFHKFSQVNREEYEKQGSGLGLYISRSYVELMNGRISAESEGEGKGTSFFVEIPILKKKPFDPNEGEGSVIRSTPDQEVMKQVMQISEKHAIKE